MSRTKKKKLRNVLVLGDKTRWPALPRDDSLLITNKLKLCLPPVKINMPRVPWRILRGLSKEERRKEQEDLLNRQSQQKRDEYQRALDLRKSLFLGVNALCKGIEQNSVSSCILEADVSPRILLTHVVELANHSGVPVLAVSNLKETLRNELGFSSLVLGIQKSEMEDSKNPFHDICATIVNMSKQLVISEESKVVMDGLAGGETKTTEALTPPEDNEDDDTIVEDVLLTDSGKRNNREEPINTIDVPSLLQSIYLFRDSEDVRIFRPPVIDAPTSNADVLEDNLILPPMGKDEEHVKERKTGRYFKPLVVNQVQSNPLKKRKVRPKKKKRL